MYTTLFKVKKKKIQKISQSYFRYFGDVKKKLGIFIDYQESTWEVQLYSCLGEFLVLVLYFNH